MLTQKCVLTFAILILEIISNCQCVPIGELCSKNEDCDGYPESTECDPVLQFCLCKSDHVLVPGNEDRPIRCEPIRMEIGEPCEVTAQCTHGTPGEFSDCVPSYSDPNIKVCNCTGGAMPEPGGHECLKASGNTNIGETCHVDRDCVGNSGISSACSNSGKCSCLGGYLPSGQMDDCIAVRNRLGEICLESQQCQQGIMGILSACIYGSCKCTSFSVNQPGENFCHRKAILIGDPCKIHEQCWANLEEKSYCIGGICECTRDSQPTFDLSKCV